MAYNFFQGRSRGFAILPPDPSFVAIDFETANHDRASACAVGMARVERGRIVEQATRLLCPPDSYFSFTHIHGLAWDDVADAPSFRDGWRELKALLEGAHFLAAHNAPFDQSVLRACCRQARLRPPPQPFVCTVALAREVWDIYPTKLPLVCRPLSIPFKHHDASSDADACARIVLAAARSGPSLAH